MWTFKKEVETFSTHKFFFFVSQSIKESKLNQRCVYILFSMGESLRTYISENVEPNVSSATRRIY